MIYLFHGNSLGSLRFCKCPHQVTPVHISAGRSCRQRCLDMDCLQTPPCKLASPFFLSLLSKSQTGRFGDTNDMNCLIFACFFCSLGIQVWRKRQEHGKTECPVCNMFYVKHQIKLKGQGQPKPIRNVGNMKPNVTSG